MVAIADLIFGKLIGWYIDHYKLPGDYLKFQYMINNTNEDMLPDCNPINNVNMLLINASNTI